MKKEASFTTKFNRWAKKNLQAPALVEIKHTRGAKSFPFRELKEHQRDWLRAAYSPNCQPWKIPDTGFAFLPADVILIGYMSAYVVIKYNDFFVVIDGEKMLNEIKKSDRKSLTEERAKAIADYIV